MPNRRIYPDRPLTTKESNKRRVEKCKKLGICYACSNVNDRPGKRVCTECGVRINVQGKKDRIKLKLEVFQAYGGAICACCNETLLDFLTLDHATAKISDHKNRAGDKLYRELREKKYPPGFRVLCINCNFGRGINGGICPHESKRSEDLPGLSYADAVPREFLRSASDGNVEQTSIGGGTGT